MVSRHRHSVGHRAYAYPATRMTTEAELREKLRKIHALFEGATTAGEREAAAAAVGRVRQALPARAAPWSAAA